MSIRSLAAATCLLGGVHAHGQSVRLYSEFQRIDPFGRVAAPDRGGTPREILSPPMARNAFASFLVAVRPPRDQKTTIHIGQNPEDTLQPSLYRAVFEKTAAGLVPDRLEPVPLPYTFDPASVTIVPAQTTLVLWLDLWVPSRVSPERMRVEVQMNWGERWIIAPMEVRIQEARVPKINLPRVSLPPPEAPLDAVARAAWQAAACGSPPRASAALREVSPVRTIRSLVARNAIQDVSYARKRKTLDPPEVCATARPSAAANPEWYLRVRPALWR